MVKLAKISSIVSLFPLPQYVVVLEDSDRQYLVPIWIGVSEGNAISLEMQGEKFPRPLTHDLMINILEALNATIEKVLISDLKDNSYFAVLSIAQNGKIYEIDARPSDSLALAVRVKCPIYIDEKVLKKCPKVQGEITQKDVESFKEELKTLSPDEFFKKLEESEAAIGPESETEIEDEGEDDLPDDDRPEDDPNDKWKG